MPILKAQNALNRCLSEQKIIPLEGVNIGRIYTKGAKVRRKVQRPSPQNIKFSLISLAHSTAKADLLKSKKPRTLEIISTLLQIWSVLCARCREFRLKNYISERYADFSRTSLSGRVGQGLALLCLESRGFVYASRFDEITRQLGRGRITRQLRTSRIPDFILENRYGEWMICEAKGSFVPFHRRVVRFKSTLKSAVDQVQNGVNIIQRYYTGNVDGCAVGSWIREEYDEDESAILETHIPTNNAKTTNIHRSPLIRQMNYAKWLQFMGMHDIARHLLYLEFPVGLEKRRFYAINIGGRKIILMRKKCLCGLCFVCRGCSVVLPLIGMDQEIFRRIINIIRSRSLESLFDLNIYEQDVITERIAESSLVIGSIFSDGTFFGIANIIRLPEDIFEEVYI